MSDLEVIEGSNNLARFNGDWLYCIIAGSLDEALAELRKHHPDYTAKKCIHFGNFYYFPKEAAHGS